MMAGRLSEQILMSIESDSSSSLHYRFANTSAWNTVVYVPRPKYFAGFIREPVRSTANNPRDSSILPLVFVKEDRGFWPSWHMVTTHKLYWTTFDDPVPYTIISPELMGHTLGGWQPTLPMPCTMSCILSIAVPEGSSTTHVRIFYST